MGQMGLYEEAGCEAGGEHPVEAVGEAPIEVLDVDEESPCLVPKNRRKSLLF